MLNLVLRTGVYYQKDVSGVNGIDSKERTTVMAAVKVHAIPVREHREKNLLDIRPGTVQGPGQNQRSGAAGRVPFC
jgi:hypothetical protein